MSAQRFVKKPVTIEAWRFDGGSSGQAIAAWCGGRFRRVLDGRVRRADEPQWIDIPTLEGVMTASPGDWIVRGVAGEFYPCKPDIFDATYEAAAPPETKPPATESDPT